MPQFRSFPPVSSKMTMTSLALFVGVASFAGCDQADVEAVEAAARSGQLAGDHAGEGEFVTRIADMLDGTSRVSHHLIDGANDVQVVLPEGAQIQRGDRVRVWGEADADGVVTVDDYEIVAPAPQPIIDAEALPPRRIATILLHWGSGGLPNGEGKQAMFTGDRSTNIYYGENSYGKETMAGEVFGPYEIPEPAGCNVQGIANAAVQAMVDQGHNPNDYRQFMYHFPFIGGCGFGGLANVGSPEFPAQDSWYNGSLGCTVRNQELGHNYGMGHSHAYTCVDADGNQVPLSDDCEHIEYGHPYDPMGAGCGHMSVVQKTFMGWLEGCNVVTTGVSGTFNLLPTELPCDGTQALRFEAYDGRMYWLEYRQPLGAFDGDGTGMSGVLLNISDEVVGFGPAPYILDVGDNGFLREGDSYTDPEGVVTFTVLEEHPTHAVIDVQYAEGMGSGAAPSCRDGGEPEMAEGNVGATECAAEPYPGDVSAPTVTITYPEDGQGFEPGADFAIQADVADDRQIIEIVLYIDGEPKFKRFEEPWEWEVNDIPAGKYEFGVVARDARHWTPSNAVNIVVAEGASQPDEPGSDTDGAGETSGTGDAPDDPTLPTTGFEPADDDDDGLEVQDDGGDGCSCTTGRGASGSGALLLLGLLGLRIGARRRRSEPAA